MMRLHSVLSAGLAAFFVLPTALPSLGISQDDLHLLEDALSRTVRALEVMGTLEERLRSPDPSMIELVLSSTEPAHLPTAEGGERLETLRREVSLLQMEVDSLEASSSTCPADPARPGITTGLDEETRQSLRMPLHPEEPSTAEPLAAPSTERTSEPSKETQPELPGYSADPLRQAMACYRAGRHERALSLLESREDLEALYWRSRCLTQLERTDEAIALLTRIIESAGDSYAGRRAESDLDFLRWKKDFRARLPQSPQSGGPPG